MPKREPKSQSVDVARNAVSIRRKATGYSLLGLASFIGVWFFFHYVIRNDPFEFVPHPWKVMNRMWDLIAGDETRGVPEGKVFIHFWHTLRKTLYGFAGAILAGVPIGILMGRYRYAKNFFFDFVYIAANVPLINYAILALLIFGIGDTGPSVVMAILVLPGIALNVAAGVEGVDRNLLSMSRAYNRPTSSALRHIVFPSFASYLFAGGRASFAVAWKLGALVEAFGGASGVGVQLRVSFQSFRVADLLAWTMFFVIFVIFMERVVLMRFEQWVFRWRLKRGEDVLRF